MTNADMVSRCANAVEMAARLKKIVDRLHGEVARIAANAPDSEASRQVNELRDELQGMASLIAETRQEVAGLLPSGMPHTRLATASDELDGVVSATEQAAVEIMNAAEQVQEAVQKLRTRDMSRQEVEENLDILDSAVTDIFLACSFQDLTGQRIRKVVQALTYIEQRVLSLTKLWQDATDIAAAEGLPSDLRTDAHLLNGPTHHGLNQSDIDSLLSSAPGHAAAQFDIDALFAGTAE